jgi:hypothetical protein
VSGVRIELSGAPLIAGDLARGRLLLSPEVRVPGLSLTILFSYRVEGRGDPEEAEPASYPVLRDAPSPPPEIPFSVGLPSKPWSYAGKLVKIRWMLRVKAEINGFAQYYDEPITLLSPFVVAPERGYRS